MKRLIIILIFGLGILYIPISVQGQIALMPHYTTKDGLPSSTIYDITQDNDGYIWIATEAGVSRFDGKTFRNFTLEDGLSDIETLSIQSDSKGRLWFLGFNGTVSYWYKNKIYNASTDTLLKKITTRSAFINLFEDHEQRLWFVSQDQVILLDNGTVKYPTREEALPYCIIIDGKDQQYILTNTSQSIYRNNRFYLSSSRYHFKISSAFKWLKNKSMLFTSHEGIVHQKENVQKLLIPFNKKMQSSLQYDIEFSSDSILWLTTQFGLQEYDLKHPKAEPTIILENKATNRLLEDREGNLWIGTLDDGIFLLPVWAKYIRLLNDPGNNEDRQCYAVYKQDNEIYFGATHGRVMCIKDGLTTQLEVAEDTMTVGEINKIIGQGSNLWFASGAKVIHYNTLTGKAHLVYSLDKFGKLKYTIGNKGLSVGKNKLIIARNYLISEVDASCTGKITDPQYLPENRFIAGCLSEKTTDVDARIFSAYYSKSGIMWFGARPGLYAKKGNTVTLLATEDALLKSRMNSISETEDSILLLGTYGHGLLFYKNGKIIKRLTMKEGLTNNICKKVFVFNKHIYVATPSGLSIIPYKDGNTGEIIRLSVNNILPFNEVNDVYADAKEILVATSNGLLSIRQSAIGQIKSHLPVLHIEEFTANGLPLNQRKNAILRHAQNSIRLQYTGINFQLPKEVYYRYRLGAQQEWQITQNNLLEFPYLPAGDYVFQIQARVANSSWSEPQSLAFTILPPFWKTWWFYLLELLAISSTVYLIVNYRIREIRNKQREKSRLEKQITALEQEALQSMMNPHFIFNVMNSIQHFINNNDKTEANKYLSNFAKLIRMNLAISYKKYIPLEEELDYLRLYLSFEKLRFGEKMHYEIELDPAIDCHETHIAVMMIQPFLENAIWHGILPLNQPGTVTLTIKRHNDATLNICISDTGAGIDGAFLKEASLLMESKSHGIQITIRRLALITKATGHPLQLTYRHVHPLQTNKGTCVEFLLPVAV